MCNIGAANRLSVVFLARIAGGMRAVVFGIVIILLSVMVATAFGGHWAATREGGHESDAENCPAGTAASGTHSRSLFGSASALRTGAGGTPICQLPDTWGDDVIVTVNSEAVGAPGLQFVSRKMSPSSQIPTWEICARRAAPDGAAALSTLPSRDPLVVPVARLTLSDRVMSLIPASGNDATTTRHLTNCLFMFGVGSKTLAAQTRKPRRAAPLVHLFSAPSHWVDFHLYPMPRADCCTAELTLGAPALAKELAKAIEIPDQLSVTLNRPLILPLCQWPDAQIEFRLLAQRDALRLVAIPRYKLGAQRRTLTMAEVAKHGALQSKLYQRGRNELASARARLAQIPKEMREISQIKVRTPAQRGLRSLHLAVRDREAAKLRASLHRLNETLPQLKHNIKRLQDLFAIVQRLDQQVQVSIRLLARTSAGDIVLGTTAAP